MVIKKNFNRKIPIIAAKKFLNHYLLVVDSQIK